MMKEWLLWANCCNKCDFCWQCHKPIEGTFLKESDMMDSLKKCISDINELDGDDDVLIVGGEAYCFYSNIVSSGMHKLFNTIRNKMEQNHIRYFYVNTNLIYYDLRIIDDLCLIFSGYRDRIKFTTSYDLFGRFNSKESEGLFLYNLKEIKKRYQDLNIVANIILTKQACDQIISEEFDFVKFKEDYELSYINFLPYISMPNELGESMKPKFSKVLTAMEHIEKNMPGYLEFYYHDYNDNQDKYLKQYISGKGYQECTATYMECGHNKNFTLATDNGKCFICEIKKYLQNR